MRLSVNPVLALLVLFAGDVQAQTGSLDGFEARSLAGMPYRLFVPRDYDPDRKYPLILSLHGAGERGVDNEKQLRDSAALVALFASAAAQVRQPAFLVAPQCPEGQQWVDWPWASGSYDLAMVNESEAIGKALSIVAAVEKEFTVDPDRRYVIGLSMGAFGAWDVMLRHPELWAAGVATDGAGAPAAAATMRNLPVWAFHAEHDAVVPVSGSREMFAALVEAGATPTFTEYATGGHGAWQRASQTLNMFSWLFAQVRGEARSQPAADLAFVPNGGPAESVTLTSSLKDAVIRYTTDGRMPSPSSGTLYSEPIAVRGDVTIRAISYQPNALNRVSVLHGATFSPADRSPGRGDAGPDQPLDAPAESDDVRASGCALVPRGEGVAPAFILLIGFLVRRGRRTPT